MKDDKVPSLDKIAGNPELASTLDYSAIAALQALIATVQSALASRTMVLARTPPEELEHENLINVKEAAKRLKSSTDWIYSNAATLPFVVHLRRGIRISPSALRRYIAGGGEKSSAQGKM